MTTRDELVEMVAKIVRPDLWGTPFGYPDEIDSDTDLARARANAMHKAGRIVDAILSSPPIVEVRETLGLLKEVDPYTFIGAYREQLSKAHSLLSDMEMKNGD